MKTPAKATPRFLRPTLFAALGLLGVAPLLGSSQGPTAGTAQPPSTAQASVEPTFSGEARVTATDVVVDVLKKETLLGGSREPARALGREQFEVFLDGRPAPLVGAEPPGADPSGRGAEPWSLLIYLDPALHGDLELRWAAGLLMEESAALAALGTVQIVVADPRPRTVLEPTRDVDALAEALSSLALEAEGDDALTTLREAVLEAGGDLELEPAALAELEASLVRERLDTFLLHLVERIPATARRAVFPLGLGFDPYPEAFYGAEGSEAPGAAPEGDPRKPAAGPDREPQAAPEGSLARAAQDLSRTLAAYGWVALPVASPLPENRAKIKTGLRIGKFRLGPASEPGMFLKATWEEDRDPEKAEAHYQVGLQHRKAGDLVAATESFQRAIFHYYGDPRTAEGQILAYRALGETLETLGDEEGARRAFEAARDLKSHPKVVARQQRESQAAARADLQVPEPAEPGLPDTQDTGPEPPGSRRASSETSNSETPNSETPDSETSDSGPRRSDAADPERAASSPSSAGDSGAMPDAQESWLARPAGAADIDPAAALEGLATDTTGRAIRGRGHLQEALGSLGRRYRLTYQLETAPLQPEAVQLGTDGIETGSPRGEAPSGRPPRPAAAVPGSLLHLTARTLDPGFEVWAPSHARTGTPETVAAARLRQLVASELPNEAGELEAEESEPEDGELNEGAARDPSGPAEVRVAVDLGGHGRTGDALRLSYARAGDEGELLIRHLPLPAASVEAGSHILVLPRDDRRPGLVLLLDNLSTGAWAATILDL